MIEIILFVVGCLFGGLWFTVIILPLFYGIPRSTYYVFKSVLKKSSVIFYLKTLILWTVGFQIVALIMVFYFQGLANSIAESVGFTSGTFVGIGMFLVRALTKDGREDLNVDFWTVMSAKGYLTTEGSPDAQNQGRATQVLDELAGQALQKIAESDDPRAQTALGDEYQMGVGIAKTPDFVKAAYWYQRAAEQGFAKAQKYLGEMYKSGKGVSQDFSKAVFWYHRAANQGHTMAQLGLGILYAKGEGVPKDLVQAYKWIALAEPNLPEEYFMLSGVSPNELLSALEDLMTPSQILHGKRLAEEWKSKPE